MPKIQSEISHDLGQQEAIKRLKDACDWAHGVSDLSERWFENVLEFSTSIQGVKVSGQVEVNEGSLRLTGKIPLVAVPFKSWIPNILRNALKERKKVQEIVGTVSDAPLILYLHIPKAGGTTLGEFIYNQCKSEDETDEGLIKSGVFFITDGFFREAETELSASMQNTLQRRDLRAVIGHFAFGIHKSVEKPVHYVTILRDPVKRVISLYNYLDQKDTMSLEEFAKSPPYREIDNDQTRRIAGVNPEIGMVQEKDLETAKKNLREHFSVVGTTERFDETLVLLSQELGWTKWVPSTPKNVTSKRSSSYSPESIKAIQSRNIFDIELHNFANQLMDKMIASQGDTFFELLKQQRELNSSNHNVDNR